MPSTTLSFFSFINDIASFQLYLIDDLAPEDLKLSDYSPPKNGYFELMNYGSTDFINETDTLFLMMVITLLLFILTFTLMLINDKKSLLLVRLTKHLRESLIWNGLIRFMIESYLPLALAAFFNASKLDSINF